MRALAWIGIAILGACATVPEVNTLEITPVVSKVSDESLSQQIEAANAAFDRRDFAAAFDAYRPLLHVLPEGHAQRGAVKLALAESALKLSGERPALRKYAGQIFTSLDAGSPPCRVKAGLALSIAPKTLDAAVKNCPDDARLWNAIGRIHDQNKNWVEAVEAYVAALSLSHKAGDNTAPVLNNLGMSLLMQGRADEAAIKFDQARTRDAEQPTYDNNFRLALIQDGRIGEALDGVPDARAAQIYNDAGYLAQRAGRRKSARAYYKKAISLSPVYFAVAADNLASLDLPIPDNSSTRREQIVQGLLAVAAP